jgi:hypothetical protein
VPALLLERALAGRDVGTEPFRIDERTGPTTRSGSAGLFQLAVSGACAAAVAAGQARRAANRHRREIRIKRL